MKWTLTHDRITPKVQGLIGAKACQLARLAQLGHATAPWLCITTEAYNSYLNLTGIRERIGLELHRKVFEQMRWEELWDCSLRIRHLFQTVPLPGQMRDELARGIIDHLGRQPVVVRSSATGEDGRQSSFAGLHASYVNVKGTEDILKHMTRVWASLWSDAALLYRKEIGLDIASSTMAVVVQGFMRGEASGVIFTCHPTQADAMVLEAVHGLNQGLVDGLIEPDRWTIARADPEEINHTPARRRSYIVAEVNGVEKADLPQALRGKTPVNVRQVRRVADAAMSLEKSFGTAQDVEWTFAEDQLFIIQTRDITTLPGDDHQRGWYLSLHRSYEQLVQLREKIEGDYIPAMKKVAQDLADIQMADLDDEALIQEIRRRWELNKQWSAIYWSDFIPYAHGVRLLGHFYNDALSPADPYEFVDLLTQTSMQSLERNQCLMTMADMLRDHPDWGDSLSPALDRNPLEKLVAGFLDRFGDLSTDVTGHRAGGNDLRPMIRLLTEMAQQPTVQPSEDLTSFSVDQRRDAFLNHFTGQARRQATEMLDLARSSYQLRDDDNIHLGRIEARFKTAVDEARRRLACMDGEKGKTALRRLLEQIAPEADDASSAEVEVRDRFKFRQRQLVGQPAGSGVAKGIARVVNAGDPLTDFKAGEILVCDAVDPNITFVVPLAVAIVERRGGMLIHGAIIAREYGLPCVTGVPHATTLIRSGAAITVDGYLGIVTFD